MKTNFEKIMNKIYDKKIYSKEKCEEILDNISNKVFHFGTRIKLKGIFESLIVEQENSYYNTIKVLGNPKIYCHRDVEKVYGREFKIGDLLYLINKKREEEYEKYNHNDDINKEYNKIYLKIIEFFSWNSSLKYGLDAGCAETGNPEVEHLFMLIDSLKLNKYVDKHWACINPDKNDGLIDSDKLTTKK